MHLIYLIIIEGGVTSPQQLQLQLLWKLLLFLIHMETFLETSLNQKLIKLHNNKRQQQQFSSSTQ